MRIIKKRIQKGAFLIIASALESYMDILVLSMVTISLLISRFTTFPVEG